MTTTHVAVHTISFRGKAGAIFVLLCCSITLFLLGFITHDWSMIRRQEGTNQTGAQPGESATGALPKNYLAREGLWESCVCQRVEKLDQAWFYVVQALVSVGLCGLFIAFLLISVYMCVHTVSKNSTIIALGFVCFIAAIIMLVGLILYAVYQSLSHYTLSWSYALLLLSTLLSLVAGFLSVAQLRSSNVKCC